MTTREFKSKLRAKGYEVSEDKSTNSLLVSEGDPYNDEALVSKNKVGQVTFKRNVDLKYDAFKVIVMYAITPINKRKGDIADRLDNLIKSAKKLREDLDERK